jgi:hypothetical protein
MRSAGASTDLKRKLSRQRGCEDGFELDRFEPPAIGEGYPVEVRAMSDDGQFQAFDRGGTLTVVSRHD